MTTVKGEPFILFDSGPGKDRIIVFTTKANLDILQRTVHIYMDGTFKISPTIFFQLYTIHGFIRSTSFPLIYALLPNKIKETFTRLLEEVKKLIAEFHPQSFLIDYEMAMYGAIRAVFPEASIRGCFFHFSQALYRKLWFEAKIRHRQREFAQQMKLLAESLPQDAGQIVDYFEETWIGPVRRNRRRPPVFPVEMWNCFAAIQDDLPSTNNHIEGWHMAFKSQLSACHPTIWKFIEASKENSS